MQNKGKNEIKTTEEPAIEKTEKSNFFSRLNNFVIKLQGVSLTQKLFFTKNLSVMVKAGLSISVSIKTLARQTPNKYFRIILNKAYLEIEKGNTLSGSLRSYPDVFSEVFVNMIDVGEKSGNLEQVLKQLTIQLKKTHELTSKVKSALAYPAFILFAMFGIGTLIIVFVIPQVIDIFSNMDIDLPLPTKILIAVSSFITNNGILVVVTLLILLIATIQFLRTKTGKYYLHFLLLKIPPINGIVKKITLAKFSRTFGSLLATDIPIVKTTTITATVLGNTIYKDYVKDCAEEIKKGQSIAKTLGRDQSLFPPVVTQMIQVGEETGTLDNILNDLAEFYEEEIKNTMEGLASIIEPVLIIILGIAVAGMAISIIMPMYSISESIK